MHLFLVDVEACFGDGGDISVGLGELYFRAAVKNDKVKCQTAGKGQRASAVCAHGVGSCIPEGLSGSTSSVRRDRTSEVPGSVECADFHRVVRKKGSYGLRSTGWSSTGEEQARPGTGIVGFQSVNTATFAGLHAREHAHRGSCEQK